MKKSKKETSYKKSFYERGWFIAVAVILGFLLVPLTSLLYSYNLYAAGIRIACAPRNIIEPENYSEVLAGTVQVADIDYESSYENGFLDLIYPKNISKKLPLLVYIHGGYYVGGDKKSAEPYCRVIANDGYIVANINYALAPNEKYPSQVLQTDEAIKFLIKNAEAYKIDTQSIFIGGDSAGGHLTGQMGAVYTNQALAEKVGLSSPAIAASQLKGVLLLCGFYNTDTLTAKTFPFLGQAMWMVTGEKDWKSYSRLEELNTQKNITEAYPATFITCGDKDPLLSQSEDMAAALKAKGVFTLSYFPISAPDALNHEYQRDFRLNECQTAMILTLEFMKTHM